MTREPPAAAFPGEPSPMPTAADLMTPAPRTCSTFSTVLEAVMIFRDADCGAVPVTEDGAPVGILTDRDVALALIDKGGRAARPARLRHHDPRRRLVSPDATLEEIEATFAEKAVRRLLVIDAERSARRHHRLGRRLALRLGPEARPGRRRRRREALSGSEIGGRARQRAASATRSADDGSWLLCARTVLIQLTFRTNSSLERRKLSKLWRNSRSESQRDRRRRSGRRRRRRSAGPPPGRSRRPRPGRRPGRSAGRARPPPGRRRTASKTTVGQVARLAASLASISVSLAWSSASEAMSPVSSPRLVMTPSARRNRNPPFTDA